MSKRPRRRKNSVQKPRAQDHGERGPPQANIHKKGTKFGLSAYFHALGFKAGFAYKRDVDVEFENKNKKK